jgi:hypothetical protein
MSDRGLGKVLDLNLSTGIALVQLFEGGTELEYPAMELRIEKTTRCTDCRGCSVSKLADDEEEAVRPDEETRVAAARIAAERAAGIASEHVQEPEYADL